MSKHALWVTLFVAVSVFFGTMYVAVQQALRVAANDPQSGMAQDVAAALDDGSKPEDLLTGRTDVNQGSAFVVIYDKSGQVVAGNGYLEGNVLEVPLGVLEAAGNSPYHIHRVTLQPTRHVRIAAVAVSSRDYYVLGGRSLFVTEVRTKAFGQWMLGCWVAALVAIAVIYRLASRRLPRKTTKRKHT